MYAVYVCFSMKTIRQTNHRIDWDSAECVIYSTDYYQRLTLEAGYVYQLGANATEPMPTATCSLQTTD